MNKVSRNRAKARRREAMKKKEIPVELDNTPVTTYYNRYGESINDLTEDCYNEYGESVWMG